MLVRMVVMIVAVVVVVVAHVTYYCYDVQYLYFVNGDLDANRAKIADKHDATIVEITVELMALLSISMDRRWTKMKKGQVWSQFMFRNSIYSD